MLIPSINLWRRMRLIKTASILVSSLILAVALLVTIGMHQQNILVVIALWLAVLPLILGILSAPMVSRLVANRDINSNTNLVRLLNRQEQHLDLLSRKLDLISEELQIPGRDASSIAIRSDEMIALAERIKLLERRFLGSLENELHANERRFRKIEAMLETITTKSQKHSI